MHTLVVTKKTTHTLVARKKERLVTHQLGGRKTIYSFTH